MTAFYKLSGGGNDFLALAAPRELPGAAEIAAWCRRGISIGADGLFVLRPLGAGRVGMDYWNADGLPADLCLNGTRSAAQLAFTLGWNEDAALTVVTAAGEITARRVDASRITLELPAPENPEEITVEGPEGPCRGFRLTVGVPHFVLLWPAAELERAPVTAWGPPLRRHPAFGAPGTNVDFLAVNAPDRLAVRTFERGVEDETLCCGTGVIASTAVALATGEARLPATVWTQGGFELTVDRAGDDRWTLTGDARLVARGEILPGALPAAPPT